jgi:hypothetical protein
MGCGGALHFLARRLQRGRLTRINKGFTGIVKPFFMCLFAGAES